MYLHGNEERLLQAANKNRVDGLEATSVSKKANKDGRLQDWQEKVLNDQQVILTKEIRSEQSWFWVQNGDLKRETESLIVAAQN